MRELLDLMKLANNRQLTSLAGVLSKPPGPLALALFIALGLASYASVIGTSFLSDDFVQIGRVLGGDLSVVWGREHGGFFRPVFILSYAIDVAIWGQRASGFHLTNIGLHAVNSFLVFLFARQWFESEGLAADRRDAAALAAGFLFLLHPSHGEAVSWISGRADVLATFFGLASLILYARRAGARPGMRLALSLLCFFVALLSKESAAFIPFAIFLLASSRADGSPISRVAAGLKQAAPFALTLAAYVVARAVAIGSLIGGYGVGRHLELTHSIVSSQLLRFPLRVVFPAILLRHVPFLESRWLSPVLIMTGALVALALAVALSRVRRRKAFVSFARRNAGLWVLVALFFCALVPVINLRIDMFTTDGERYLYFPSVFFCILVANLLWKSIGQRRGAIVALICILIFYSVALWRTNRQWSDADQLTRSIVDDLSTQMTSDSILILSVPDNFRGAYVFRNGLPEALLWFHPGTKGISVRVMAWHGLRSANGGADLKRDPTGEFTLSLTNEGEEFGRIEDLTDVELIERDRKRLRLRFRDGASALDRFYFSGGRMVRITGDQGR